MSKRKRIVVRLNKNLGMSPNKAAAQAVHAALNLLGVHPGEEVPVIVLSASKTTVMAQQSVIADHGTTEVKPGSITAGASWDFPVGDGGDPDWQRISEAYEVKLKADAEYARLLREYYKPEDTGPVTPFGYKEKP